MALENSKQTPAQTLLLSLTHIKALSSIKQLGVAVSVFSIHVATALLLLSTSWSLLTVLHSIRGNTSPPHHLTTPRLTHGAEGHSNNFLTWTFLRNFYTTPRHTPPNGHRIWVSLECFKTVDKYGGPLIFPLSDNRYLYDAYFLSLLECKVSANRLGSPGWISHA